MRQIIFQKKDIANIIEVLHKEGAVETVPARA
jgi:hypothetical protein